MTVLEPTDGVTIHVGDVRQVLPTLRAESVDLVATSPPFFGLRDYGTGAWTGGDEDCDHIAQTRPHRIGGTKAAIQACCDTAMFYDARYRVVAISTPASIYSDMLQRLPNLGRSGTRKANGVVQAPEAQMLAAAGRREMPHPRLDRTERAVFVDDDTWEPRPFA